MSATCLSRWMGELSIAVIALVPWPASAQSWSFVRGIGTASYTWSNATVLPVGGRLEVRHVIMNVGDTAIAAPYQPCDMKIETDLELGEPERSCSAEVGRVAAGDSAWAFLTASVRSQPGRYRLTVDLPGTHFDQGPVEVRKTVGTDPKPPAPPLRVPVVLELTRKGEGLAFGKPDVEDVLGQAATGGPGVMVIPVSRTVAEVLASFTPYLELHIEVQGNQYSLSGSWRGSAHQVRSPAREWVATGSTSSEMSLGLTIGDFFRRLLRERFAGSASMRRQRRSLTRAEPHGVYRGIGRLSGLHLTTAGGHVAPAPINSTSLDRPRSRVAGWSWSEARLFRWTTCSWLCRREDRRSSLSRPRASGKGCRMSTLGRARRVGGSSSETGIWSSFGSRTGPRPFPRPCCRRPSEIGLARLLERVA